jgi:hypothetical protein
MGRILVVLSLLLAACAATLPELRDEAGTDLLQAPHVYTLVNLHPDEQHARLYAVNYQQLGLIPLCTEVELLELTTEQLTFRVIKRNKQYYYFNHEAAAAEPFDRHLVRFFGSNCDVNQTRSLSEVDQAGIRKGSVSTGMSKQGVIYALGYPPRHVTPDLDAAQWIYWKNRFSRMIVMFDEAGIVIDVRD